MFSLENSRKGKVKSGISNDGKLEPKNHGTGVFTI